MAPESERARCESMSGFNLVHDPMRCDLPLGHEGNHTAAVGPRNQLSWLASQPDEPTLTCSEVVERLAKCCTLQTNMFGHYRAEFDTEQATAILHSWRERRVQELEAEHELFLSQLKTALGLADDGRVWFGTGLLARAETLVQREAESREQIRKGAKHE